MNIKFRPTFLPLLKVSPSSLLPMPHIHHSSWLVLVVNFMGDKEKDSDWSPTYLQNFKNKTPAVLWGNNWMNIFKEQNGHFFLLPTFASQQCCPSRQIPKKQTNKQTNPQIPDDDFWKIKYQVLTLLCLVDSHYSI